jgi:toxin-antitoxin system PIN domain toxin
VTYLLDVNALVALAMDRHEFHERVATWVRRNANKVFQLATCPITELGFIRVLAQVPDYRITIAQAQSLLARLKSSKGVKVLFITDDHDVSRLPRWVKRPRQTTDGHLAELARAKGALLATLDRGIPGAFRIPTAGT